MKLSHKISILAIGAILVSYSLFMGSFDFRHKNYESLFAALGEIDSVETYLDVIEKFPKNNNTREYYEFEGAYDTFLRKKMAGTCSVGKIWLQSTGLEWLRPAQLLQPNADLIRMSLSDTDHAIEEPIAKIEYQTTVQWANYNRPGSSNLDRLPTGRIFEGTLQMGDTAPQSFRAVIPTSSTVPPGNNTVEFWKNRTLRAAFDSSFRPVFAKSLIAICDPLAVAVFYLDLSDWSIEDDSTAYRRTFQFVQDDELDAFLMEHISQLAPLFYAVQHDYFGLSFIDGGANLETLLHTSVR